MYLAIVAIGVLMIPVLLTAIQQKSFMEGFAAGNMTPNRYKTTNY